MCHKYPNMDVTCVTHIVVWGYHVSHILGYAMAGILGPGTTGQPPYGPMPMRTRPFSGCFPVRMCRLEFFENLTFSNPPPPRRT